MKTMKKYILSLLLLLSQLTIVEAQMPITSSFDSLVSSAVAMSEKSLYEANFKEAKKYVKLSYFEDFDSFNEKHKILITIQNIKIQGLMDRLFELESNANNNLQKLLYLLPHAQKLEDKNIGAKYFNVLSSVYRSIGNKDSSSFYEHKALTMFNKTGNYRMSAVLRAGKISRVHYELLRDTNKEAILSLIPSYEKEIKFSSIYSKYALAYNTRHLAQIHRRQTLNYKEALRLFQTSLSLREEIGFMPFLPASYSSLGDVYIKMGDASSAVESYLKSVELAKKIGFVRYQFHPLVKIGDIYLNQDNKDTAKEFYIKALKAASRNNYLPGINEAREKLNFSSTDK